MKRLLWPLVLVSCSAHAEFWDGNKLLQALNGNHSEQMMALGYVVGVADAVRSRDWCPTSPAITAGQIADVVKIALERTPSVRHLTGDTLVSASLASTWPCASNRGGQGGKQL